MSNPALRAFWIASCLCACMLAVGCKSGPCQREIATCLKRCDASGTDMNRMPQQNNPQETQTPCERRCQNCRSTPSPAPAGTPTPTGSAP